MVGYDDLEGAIRELTKGRVLPHDSVASEHAVSDMIMKRKLICSVELKEAFGMQDASLMEMLERMRDSDKIEMYPVKDERYIKVRD